MDKAMNEVESQEPKTPMLPSTNPSAGKMPRRAKDREILISAVVEVMETMFYQTVEVFRNLPLQELPKVDPPWFHSSVTFTGAFTGMLQCWLPASLAEILAKDFLGLSEEDPLTPEERDDLIAELTNMICGRWLSKLQHPLVFDLEHPAVSAEPPDWCPALHFEEVPSFVVQINGIPLLVRTIGEK